MDSSPSSSTVSIPKEVNLNELITRRHAILTTLPEELCAASRPSSPASDERVTELKDRMLRLANLASLDPTNPKWGYLSRLTSLGCTSRGYVGVERGVRLGEGGSARVGKKFKWELPGTAEEWAAYEKRWEEAVAEEAERKKAKAGSSLRAHKTSKYCKKSVEEVPKSPPRPSAQSSKAEVIREKVERWQAQVATVAVEEDVPMSQETVSISQPPTADKAVAKEQPLEGGKVQVSLGFRIVKRSSATSGKGGSSASLKPKAFPPEHVPTPPNDRAMPLAPGKAPEPGPVNATDSVQGMSEPAVVAQISEVPEFSFLPPSFPSQLQTSTPPLNDRRHKPPSIVPHSPPPSSPFSTKSFNPSRPKRRAAQQASSSQPAVSPVRKSAKRARTPNPTSDDVNMDHSPSARSPLGKKARIDIAPEAAEVSRGSALTPPSTPPPTSPLPAVPVTPVSRGKDLGNAKGLPVPTTPNSHPLPTLTELLASSRRSKPRPRPPSRKNTPHSKHSANDKMSEPTELSVITDDEAVPSPAKTYFSSPASGSSGSSGSPARRSRSPISPLGFTQHPSGFVPRFVSSQRLGADVANANDDPFIEGYGQTQGSGLMRGSSGFFGVGYSSQFDVEGHVEQVSELLERDVDFNGWLRDLGTEDDADDEMPAAVQGQDAGAVGADF